MKLLRLCVLLLFVSSAFAQRGGFRGGGGGFRGGGGFTRGGGFSGHRGGSHFSRGGFSRGFIGSSYGFGRGYGFRGYPRVGFGFGIGFGSSYYGGYPGYYSGYYASPSYFYSYPAYPYYAPAPIVVRQDFGPPPPAQVRDYAPSPQYKEPIYLIAFKDHRIQAAVAYWVEAETLHYVTRDHEQKQVPLAEIDRSFSEQINRDRRVEFRLPR